MLACMAIGVLAPVFLLVMLALLIQGEGIFYLQKRPGKHNTPFNIIKFCTMRRLRPGETAGVQDYKRLTPVGAWLRSYSLNELPQLFNVIKGDMSIVGPRPLLMDYLPLYSKTEQLRHQVKPGITGLAQIKGRNSISFKSRFQYDVWYVKHRSHLLDIYIILQTLRQLFFVQSPSSWNRFSPKFDGTN